MTEVGPQYLPAPYRYFKPLNRWVRTDHTGPSSHQSHWTMLEAVQAFASLRPLLLPSHRDSRRVQPTETLHHHNHLACSAIPACCCWRPLCVEGGYIPGYTWLTERLRAGVLCCLAFSPLDSPPPPGLPPPLAFHNHNNPTTHTAMNTSSNQERRRGTPAEHQQQHAQHQQQHAGIAEQARWLWWCNVSVG